MSNRPAAETDVECLCKAIYDHGERYMDGTAAINFTELRMVRLFIIDDLFMIDLFQGFPWIRQLDKCHYQSKKVRNYRS